MGHPVGPAGRRLEVLLGEVQAAPEEVLLGLEVLRELEVLPVPELQPLVRQAQSLERFLLLVLRLQVLEWLAWSAPQ